MEKDLPRLQQRPLPGRVYPWGKLQVTRLDSLLLQRWLVCEIASLWEKPPVRRPLKEMLWSQPSQPLSPLSYEPYVSLALALVRPPDWAVRDLAQYKLRRIRLQKAEQEFSSSYA
jgi:hypothetical protein